MGQSDSDPRLDTTLLELKAPRRRHRRIQNGVGRTLRRVRCSHCETDVAVGTLKRHQGGVRCGVGTMAVMLKQRGLAVIERTWLMPNLRAFGIQIFRFPTTSESDYQMEQWKTVVGTEYWAPVWAEPLYQATQWLYDPILWESDGTECRRLFDACLKAGELTPEAEAVIALVALQREGG